MRIIIESPEPDDEDVIIVRCATPDQRLLSMLLAFQNANTELTGYTDDKIVRLNYQDVYYFEANENRVFAYYHSEVYEVRYKLYELEEDVRKAYKLQFCEKIVISRQYVRGLKNKLGVEEV